MKNNYRIKNYFKELLLYISVGYVLFMSTVIVGFSLLIAEITIKLNFELPAFLIVIIVLIALLILSALVIFFIRGRGTFKSFSPNAIDQILFITLFSSLGIHILFTKLVNRYYVCCPNLSCFAIGIFFLSVFFISFRIAKHTIYFHDKDKLYYLDDLKNNILPDNKKHFYIDEGCNSDVLSRDILIQEVIDSVFESASYKERVVGITGTWGSGKSALLNLAWKKYKINNLNNIVFIDGFDCWQYEDQRSLLIGIIEKIYRELKLGSLDRNFFAQVEALADSILNDNIKSDLVSFIFPKKNSFQLLNLIKNSLMCSNKHYVFVLDNIDRASRENIIYVYKAISSSLKICNLTYVCLYDEEIVKDALEKSGYNYKYLNKILDSKIVIPKIDERFLPGTAKVCFENYINKYYGDTLDYYIDWNQIYKSIKFIDNPRDLRRLINFFHIKLNENSYLNVSDLVTICVIKTINPSLYNLIYENKRFFTVYLKNEKPNIVWNITEKEFVEKYFTGKDSYAQYLDLIYLSFPSFSNLINDVGSAKTIKKEFSKLPIEYNGFFESYFIQTNLKAIKRDVTYKFNILENGKGIYSWEAMIKNVKNKCDFGDYIDSYCEFIIDHDLMEPFIEKIKVVYRNIDINDKKRLAGYFCKFLSKLQPPAVDSYLEKLTNDIKNLAYYLDCYLNTLNDDFKKKLKKLISQILFKLSTSQINLLTNLYYEEGVIRLLSRFDPNFTKIYLSKIASTLKSVELYTLLKEFSYEDNGKIEFIKEFRTVIDKEVFVPKLTKLKSIKKYNNDLVSLAYIRLTIPF
ncbi:MAG: KAP family NTPase [Bacilli bacterium]|nr:KAP family NTPase [Bacilli bacterium]